MNKRTHLRVARPTDRINAVTRFYVVGIGLQHLDSFVDHEGFDGVMLGAPDAAYHLEFTRRPGHAAGVAPNKEQLLVFYLPDPDEWKAAIGRMTAAGFHPVPSINPYWDRGGVTFEDPDGYGVVLYNGRWSG
jgi:hypothetical protein